MDMNESERDNNHFEENMLETLKSLEGMPISQEWTIITFGIGCVS